jgi:PIN domain nuclease of toxin-antitoxin system
VLDASAVLALLNRETGWQRIETVLPRAAIATPNLAEVLTRLVDAGIPENDAWHAVELLDLETVPFTGGHARTAAQLRPAARGSGLSLGDRACLALALALKKPVYTTDRSWARLDLGIDVHVVR